MELATSLPEKGNVSLLKENVLSKSTSITIENKEEVKKDIEEEDDDEEYPIKPFGKLKSSLENINNNETPKDLSSDNVQSSSSKEELKMVLEYEKVLRSYLPFHLQNYLESLCEEEADTMKTSNIETFCVIAAINISEIVDFINQLQNKGKAGVKYLKEDINNYFSEVIEFIVNNKGDIVNLSEKTLVISWTINENDMDVDDCSKNDLTFDAIKACLKLLENYGTHTFEFEDLHLDYVAKIGMDAGLNNILLIEVEKDHLWQYINQGPVITQAYSVLNYNTPGKLGISHQTLRCIGAIINIPSLNLGAYDKKCIVIDNVDGITRKVAEMEEASENGGSEESIDIEDKIERCAQFVNDDLVYRFQSCLYEIPKYHEELKLTTLFIKTDEFPLETNDDLEIMQKLINLIIKTLTKYEGILNNLYYEENKLNFECLFGIPPLVHENDALYAVEAAIEIAGFLRRLINNCYYISITTGISWYTGLGNKNFGRFFMFGENTDYTHKIFTSPRSKYSILCDETTYLLTESYINFVDIGAMKYKNNNCSKKLYIVINLKKHVSIMPSSNDISIDEVTKNDYNLIGKAYQWNLSVSLLRKFVHSGKRKVIIIQGEEGCGITPFVKNFEKKAIEEGCSVCIGKVNNNTSLVPFAIFESLLREVIKVTINEKRKQERQRRRRNLESLIEEDEEYGIDKKSINESIKSLRDLPIVNNFKMIGRKSALKKSYGPRSALRNGKMKKSASSTVSFENSVVVNTEHDQDNNDTFKVGEKKKIKKRSNMFDEQETIITNNTNIKNYTGNTFEEDILEALFYLDEREEIAPLLNIIYYNRFESTNEVKIINKRMIFFEFCNLICRLLTKLSFITPLVIILDNAHMQDYFSWKLTNMIFKKCTKLFLCICTRPQSFYTTPEIKTITKEIWNSLYTTAITLDKFSETDTQKFMTLYYNEFKKLKYIKNKCSKVNNEFIFNLWKLTEGNPLLVLRTANSLFNDNITQLDEDFTLQLQKPFSELEVTKHASDLKSILRYQISTLDPDFRNLLFLFSLINRKVFSINTINDFVKMHCNSNKKCESVNKFINQDNLNFGTYDKYGFLKRFYKFKKREESIDCESKDSSLTNISINSNSKCLIGNEELPIGIDSTNYDVIFSFSGELIKEIIYEDESIDNRLTLHELYGKFIEEKDEDDYFSLYYHFCNSNNNQKMVYYLSKVCHVMYKMGANHLASSAYELLLTYYGEIIETDDNTNNNIDKQNIFLLSRKTIKNPKEKVKINEKPCNYELAQMFYEMGICNYALFKYRNAELYFLKTLDYLVYKFPEKNVSLVVKLIKETKKREQYKKLSEKEKAEMKKGEMNRIEKLINEIKDEKERNKVLEKYKKKIEKGSLSLCQKSLYMLYEVYNIYHKSIHAQIALLMALNDPSTSETGFKYAEILAKYGLELVWVYSTNATGWSYLNSAEDIINPDKNDLPILKMTRSHLIVYDCLAVANIFLKSWSKGKHFVDIIIKLSQQTGDTEIWGRATILKSLLYFQTGAVDKSFRLAKEVYNNSTERNIWKSQCTALLMTLQYFGAKEAIDNIFTPLNVINIVFNLPCKINSSNNEDVVLYAGLILDACFRFKVPISNIFDFVKRVIPSLEKLEPSSYYSVFSFPQYVIVLFLFYEFGYLKKTHPRYELANQLLVSCLQAMDLFKETQIVQPLISMLKGLNYLIQGNNNNALISWENGAKKAKRSQFYGTMLYWKMAYYGTGEIAERSKVIVKKLTDKINVSFDLDIQKEWEFDTFKVLKARKG